MAVVADPYRVDELEGRTARLEADVQRHDDAIDEIKLDLREIPALRRAVEEGTRENSFFRHQLRVFGSGRRSSTHRASMIRPWLTASAKLSIMPFAFAVLNGNGSR